MGQKMLLPQDIALHCLLQLEEWLPQHEEIKFWMLVWLFEDELIEDQISEGKAAVLIETTEAVQLMRLTPDGYQIARYPYETGFQLTEVEPTLSERGAKLYVIEALKSKNDFGIFGSENVEKFHQALKKYF